MGVTSRLHCHKCGHKFERDYGIAILGKGSLCYDRCGNPMHVDFSLGWAVDMGCECGGTYKAEAHGCGPECGVKLVAEDVIEK
jgi:hypothetical protein